MRFFTLILSVLLTGCALFAPSYPAQNALNDEQNYNPTASDSSKYLVFGESNQSVGVVFYPGGKVAPEAYGTFASNLSQHLNALVVIVPMPLDLAVLGGQRGEKVQQQFPNVTHWLIGGHSLGGTMASALAFKQPQQWQGLFLLASYPQDKHSFAGTELPIISIIGDHDGLISVEKWQASQQLLSAQSHLLLIQGGNHANFGHYGAQEGDNSSPLSADEQQQQTLWAIKAWQQQTRLKQP